jgi:3-oxoacyl-[acyl-carrier-protein] synthase-1
MSVSVVAAGMVTVLGLDWETSCAASRAGIRRASKLDYFPFQTAEIGEPQFAIGHQVDLLTKGFEGFGRLVRLLAGAMRDIYRRITPHADLLRDSGLYLSMPDPERIRQAASIRELEDGESDLPSPPRDLAARLVVQSCQLARWPHELRVQAMSLVGHAGFADVLQRAMDDLKSGRVTTCLVGGVDSLLDEDTLTWLLNSDRLKHPAHAAGFMPGEGCAVLLLSDRATAQSEICSLEAVTVGQESLTLLDDESADGIGLWRTAQGLISDRRPERSRAPALISDHNGEVYRAREFGGMLVRFRNRTGIEPHISYPAVSFGDTFAASGALSMATAAHSFARRYANAASNIVLSTSDGPARGAILLAGNAYGGANGWQ